VSQTCPGWQSEVDLQAGLYEHCPLVVLQNATCPAGQEQDLGVLTQFPEDSSQESTVQGFPSSQFLLLNAQLPEVLSQDAVTHKFAETHFAVLVHPTPGIYWSLVHAFLSSQFGMIASQIPVLGLHLEQAPPG